MRDRKHAVLLDLHPSRGVMIDGKGWMCVPVVSSYETSGNTVANK